jgi:hypothetical protein
MGRLLNLIFSNKPIVAKNDIVVVGRGEPYGGGTISGCCTPFVGSDPFLTLTGDLGTGHGRGDGWGDGAGDDGNGAGGGWGEGRSEIPSAALKWGHAFYE